jgi:hypothetical protein
MFAPAAIPTLIALLALLGSTGDAVAAANWVPRMERVTSCSWDRPGHNPFMGDVVAAIDRYREIPTPVRVRLKQRMQARQYDDLVDIRRDSIGGRHRYEPIIRDMHFGLDRVCRQVTRAKWTSRMHERGLVYCEAGHCILVPTVCRNVSRIERRPTEVAGAREGAPPAREAAPASADGRAAAAPSGQAPSALAVALPRIADSTAPNESSFSDGVVGTPMPLWPTGGSGAAAAPASASPPNAG